LKETEQLAGARADAVYQLVPNALASCFGAAVIAVTYWEADTALLLGTWVAVVTLQAAWLIALQFMRRKRVPAKWTNKTWLNVLTVNFAISGTIWGAGAFAVLPIGDSDQNLVASMMALGAVVTTFPFILHLPAYLAFQGPLLALAAAGYWLSASPYGWMLTTSCAALFVIQAVLGKSMGRSLKEALRLSIVNAELISQLSSQADDLRGANEQLAQLTMTDPLTGLGNRRAMMQALRMERGNAGCAFLTVDVDHFKSYNDSFGHAAGDECLKAVASILIDAAAASGGVAIRQGGEEFALVLRNTSDRSALDWAETVRIAIERAHESKDELKRPITVSVGYATGLQSRSVDDLMAAADAALYRAKGSGRNRVCGSDDSSEIAQFRAAIA